MKELKRKPNFWENLFLTVDIILCFLTFGCVGETLSSHFGKSSLLMRPAHMRLEKVVNWIFVRSWIPVEWRGHNHCFRCIDFDTGLSRECLVDRIIKKYLVTKDHRLLESLEKLGHFKLKEM